MQIEKNENIYHHINTIRITIRIKALDFEKHSSKKLRSLHWLHCIQDRRRKLIYLSTKTTMTMVDLLPNEEYMQKAKDDKNILPAEEKQTLKECQAKKKG